MRTGRVVGAVLTATLPLTVLALVAADVTRTSLVAVTVALALIVGLCTGRQLLAGAETRRLYDEVERGAEERRALLVSLLGAIEDDRRRVALQLHEQAAATYTALASLVPNAAPGVHLVGADDDASALTARLSARAESLRALIMAIRPTGGPTATGLAPIFHAFVSSLDEGTRPPAAQVHVDDSLQLDWVTETSALRIAQEAIRNAHVHGRARQVWISLTAEGDVPVLRVADDGDGFDVPEGDDDTGASGMATMRRFAGFCGGELHVTSTAGRGTTVVARLGRTGPADPDQPRRQLRPVTDGRSPAPA